MYTYNILNLLPSIAFTTFHKFLISCIFILFKMFFIVLEISSLTHMLFRSGVFFFPSLQVFGVSPALSVINFYFNSIMVWEETSIFYFLNFSKMCFMAQNVVFLGECTSLRRMCILLLSDEAVNRCRLYPVDWWCFWVQLCHYWFSACWICPFLIERY